MILNQTEIKTNEMHVPISKRSFIETPINIRLKPRDEFEIEKKVFGRVSVEGETKDCFFCVFFFKSTSEGFTGQGSAEHLRSRS